MPEAGGCECDCDYCDQGSHCGRTEHGCYFFVEEDPDDDKGENK